MNHPAPRSAPPSRLPRRTFDPGHRGPLEGLRVIDLSRLVAGQHDDAATGRFRRRRDQDRAAAPATRCATSGPRASTPGGRPMRATSERRARPAHRGAASTIVKALAATADVLVESFRAGVLEKPWDWGRTSCSDLNPRLVITRLSGWGQTGPYRHRARVRHPGRRLLGVRVDERLRRSRARAAADVPRRHDHRPLRRQRHDDGALEVRVNGGLGQVIDLSLFEPTLSILGPQAANYRFTGEIKPRTGSRSSTTAPRNAYRTADGKWVCVSTSTETMAAATVRGHRPEDITGRSADRNGTRPAAARRGDRSHRRRLRPSQDAGREPRLLRRRPRSRSARSTMQRADGRRLRRRAANAWSKSRTRNSARADAQHHAADERDPGRLHVARRRAIGQHSRGCAGRAARPR